MIPTLIVDRDAGEVAHRMPRQFKQMNRDIFSLQLLTLLFGPVRNSPLYVLRCIALTAPN